MVFEAVNAQGRGAGSSSSLTLSSFRDVIGAGFGKSDPAGGTSASLSDSGTMVFPNPLPSASELTELLFDEALKRAGGSQSVAARLLGVSPQAVSKRLKSRKTT
jgi:DNA-binding NtrC family response regulator